MPEFTYRAYAPGGALEERTVKQETAAQLHDSLAGKGYRVISLRRARKGGLYQALPSLFKVRPSELILLSRQLATFIAIFKEFHAQLPLPTRIMLAIGSFAQDYRIPILAVIGLLFVLGFVFFRTRSGKVARDYTILRLPILGPIVLFAVIERFT